LDDEPPSGASEPKESLKTEWVPGYPWWVRAMAVLHVLSLVLAPALFYVFAIAAGVMVMVRRGQIDRYVIALAWIGLACPALGFIYRGWFERWGRRNYPETLTADEPPQKEDQ
jgi:hypothetical protein